MLEKLGKWLPVVNLFIIAGLILDVFCFKGFNLWWVWILLSLVTSAAYGKHIHDKAKQEAQEDDEWEEEVQSIRQTFTDLEQKSLRNPQG